MIIIDWNTYVLGARLIYWVYLILTLAFGIGVFAYWQREHIKRVYYEIRFPEKLLIVNMIYPGNMYRKYYRLIPDDNTFEFMGGTYNYSDAAILKKNSWYAYKDKKNEGRILLNIEDREYYLDDKLKIKNRWERWPELFYVYGNPFPVDFQNLNPDNKVNFNSFDLERLKKSTILTQIYNSMQGGNLVVIILVLCLVLIVISGVIMAKVMGWVK